MDSIQSDWCPYKKGKFGRTERATYTQEEHHVKIKAEIGVLLLQAKESQRLPANHQKLGVRHRIDSSSQPSEGINAIDTFRLLASRTVRQYISVIGHPVCGNLW